MARLLLVALFVLGAFSAGAQTQTTARLPLAVDSPANALAFEAAAPAGSVLSGLLLPSTGPLTAWAPVWSTLQADGTLREASTGGWIGPRPDRWLKVVKPGFVVGGFRLLVRINATVQTRQAQVFWRPWADGTTQSTAVTSRVYGASAGPRDEVRIVELTLPDGAVPVGLYGETLASSVAQVSLLVRLAPPPPASATTAPAALSAPSAPHLEAAGPQPPTVPPVVLAKP